MIKITNLHYRYDSHANPALQAIDLEIQEGTYVAVIGPNGCGKTTLIRHLNGLLVPTEGSIQVDGMDTGKSASLRDIRQRVGMVFQNPDNQIVGMSVQEDVSFGPGNLELPSEEIRKRVEHSLDLAGMTAFADRAPHTLSGGEKQLVAIAGVLAMNPSYIVLDEPTSFLDPQARKRILGVIKSLNEKGITIVHVTHNMNDIVDADRVIVMSGGRILMDEGPSQVFSRCEWLQKLGLDVPVITELLWRLNLMGAELPPDILNMDEACRAISEVIGRGGAQDDSEILHIGQQKRNLCAAP